MNKKRSTALLSVIALLSLGTLTLTAQAEPVVVEDFVTTAQPETIPDLFLRAFTQNSGNFFTSVSYEGQFNLIFGFNEFPENQITRDAELTSIFSQDLMRQQANQVPLRTRDLANPYQSSLLQQPSYYTPFTP
ncbi:MAG: serine/threonine protein kinase [Gloeocapsa sp. DLM2.Bin57]|nr:MAG: serine/threonine protein kinase [Gloeocapsa sp. DLM2.Bin57]